MFSDLGIFYNAPKNTSLFKIIIDNKMYTHKFLFSGFLPTKPNSVKKALWPEVFLTMMYLV